MIKIRTFIAEFRIIRQYQKTMCKILRDKELLLVLFRQKHSVPLAESPGTFPQIHCHVIDFSADHAHQLVLRKMFLEMQSTQYTLLGSGLIVLYEHLRNSRSLEIVIIVSLHKISSGISEYRRSNDL